MDKKIKAKMNTRQYIGIVLTFIGIMSISSVRELVTGSICKFGEGCVETTTYILNVERLIAVVLMIVVGLCLWLIKPKKSISKSK